MSRGFYFFCKERCPQRNHSTGSYHHLNNAVKATYTSLHSLNPGRQRFSLPSVSSTSAPGTSFVSLATCSSRASIRSSNSLSAIIHIPPFLDMQIISHLILIVNGIFYFFRRNLFPLPICFKNKQLLRKNSLVLLFLLRSITHN